jgi:hypothetical protein
LQSSEKRRKTSVGRPLVGGEMVGVWALKLQMGCRQEEEFVILLLLHAGRRHLQQQQQQQEHQIIILNLEQGAQCLIMGITCGYSPKPLNMKMSQRCVKNLSQVGCSFFTIFVSKCTIFFESFSINALLVTSMTGLNSLVYSFRTDRMRLPFQLQSLQMRQSLSV